MSTLETRRSAAGTSPTRRALALAWRFIRLEWHMYTSTARLIARRPDVPRGGRGFRFDAASRTILIVFIVLSAVEIAVVDLIVHQWPGVRIAFLVIGIWGLLWMIGLLCANIVRPHTVGPGGIRARDGLGLDVAIAWDDVHSVEIRKRTFPQKTPRLSEIDGVPTFALPISDATNIQIDLEGPTRIRLPGHAPKGGEHDVSRVCIWTDDPKGFLAEVGRHI